MPAISQRRFGVEIECGHPRQVNQLISNIRSTLRYPEVSGTYDGSGCEIHTPILKGEPGFTKLRRIMDYIRETGGYVTRSDGMHVHHEAIDFAENPKLQAALVRSWCNLDRVFGSFVAPYRRGNNGAAPKTWNKAKARRLAKMEITHETRADLNLCNILPYGRRLTRYDHWGNPEYSSVTLADGSKRTIEVRLHEGCLEYPRARAWIQLCQRFLDVIATEGRTIRTCHRPNTLLKWLEVPDDSREILLDFAKNPKNPRGGYPSW